MRRTRFLLLIFFAALAACDTTDPDMPGEGSNTITGTWEGPVVFQDTTFTLRLTLQEARTAVSGAGSLSSDERSAAFQVNGSYLHPSASLQFVFTDRAPVTLTGTVTDARDHIEGRLFGAGFGGESVDLTKP